MSDVGILNDPVSLIAIALLLGSPGIVLGAIPGALLWRKPEAGKIHIVQNGVVRPKDAVLREWQKTLFLRDESLEARGWLIDVMKCVESLGKREFTLEEVYEFERHLSDLYPGNQNVKPKIRQQLQYLRDRGYIEFISRGNYRLRS
jgi:type II restriction enzyme